MEDVAGLLCRNGGIGRRPGLKIPWDFFSYRFDPGFRHHNIAGWSSSVARRAHNPKVVRFKSHSRNHMNTPLKSEPLKFEWQWCFLYKSLFYAAFQGRIFYFSIGLKNRKMRILWKAKIKTSLSNPHSLIIQVQLSRKSPHILVLFVQESCIVSSNEDGVCYKILCNHLWLGTIRFRFDISFCKVPLFS